MKFKKDKSIYTGKDTDALRFVSEFNDLLINDHGLEITRNIMKNMIIGNQYIYYDAQTRSFKELDHIYGNGGDDNKEVFNIIRQYRNIYRTILGSVIPSPVASPKFYRGDDPYKVRKTNEVIEYIKDQNRHDEFYAHLVDDMVDKGNAVSKIVIEFGKGKTNKHINVGKVKESKEFNELSNRDDVVEALNALADVNGDIFIKDDIVKYMAIMPERIRVENPSLRCIDDNDFIYDAYSVSLHKAKKTFKKLIDVSKLTEQFVDGPTGQKRKQAVKYNGSIETDRQMGVMVYERWEKPSKKWPGGRLTIIVGETEIAYDGAWPFLYIQKNGEVGYPIRARGAGNKPDTFWQDPLLFDLIPIQRRINALRNRQAEFLTNVTYPTLLVAANSLAPGTDLTPGPNKTIVYKNGQVPTNLQAPQMSGDFWTEASSLYEREAPSITGISRTRLLGESNSATRTKDMQSKSLETDLYTLEIPGKQLGYLVAETIEVSLAAFKTLFEPGEIKKLNDYDIAQGVVISDIIESVHIENINELSMSPEAIREEKMSILSLILDMNTKGMPTSFIQQALANQNFKTSVKDVPLIGKDDIDKAKRENRKLIVGRPINIMKYDDHAKHLEEHKRLMKSEEFEAYIARFNDQQREVIINIVTTHIGQHETEVAKINAANEVKAAQLQAQQNAGKGGN